MKKLNITLFFLCASFAVQAQKTTLFNGKDLSGWNIHGTELWYVEDGLLVCESGPEKKYGYLSTENFYDDFILTLEFKQEANGNSGVFFRSTLEGTKISGWQVEVAPPGHNSGGVYESYGRGWLIKPEAKKDKAPAEDQKEEKPTEKKVAKKKVKTEEKAEDANPDDSTEEEKKDS